MSSTPLKLNMKRAIHLTESGYRVKVGEGRKNVDFVPPYYLRVKFGFIRLWRIADFGFIRLSPHTSYLTLSASSHQTPYAMRYALCALRPAP
jgi:hypothetical protein